MKNKVISASAGTGKTYRLSLEYLAALLQDKSLSPQEILVMTFTVKATSEIKQRILEYLDQIASDKILQENLEAIYGKKLTREDQKHLKSKSLWLKTNKDNFKIFTLDSFMQKTFYSLVAKNLDLEQTSAIKSLSSLNKETILNGIFSNFKLQQFFADSENKNLSNFSDIADDLLNLNLQEYKFKQIEPNKEKELFQKALDKLRISLAMLSGVPKIPATAIIKKDFRDFLEAELTKSCQDFVAEFSETLKDESFFLKAHLKLKDKLWEVSPIMKRTKYLPKKLLESFQESYDEFQLSLKDYLLKTKVFIEHNQILELAKVAQKLYLKISHQELTFYDFTRILQEKFHQRGKFLTEQNLLRQEFWQFLESVPKVLMIDEFQDTSIMQYQNLLPIIKIVEEQKGSVIIVGDAKQAIYAWRGGEQELLSQVNKQLPECQSLVLDTCYRSSQNVIALVNNLFLKDYGQTWRYQKVNCASSEKGYVELEISKPEAKKDKLEHKIKDVVLSKILPALKDKDADLSKMAIIARKNNELTFFSRFLEENGVATYQKRSDSLLVHRAINPFYLYLNFLAYKDLHSLFLFLKGAPLFLSGKEIDAILKSKEKIQTFRLQKSKNLFTDFMKKFNILSFFNSPDDLKNIAAFEHILSNLNQDIIEMVEFLHENKNNLDQVADNSKQAINLLTIHSCKGLEFETVFYFLDCANKKINSPGIKKNVQYNPDFDKVEESLLTFHYPKLSNDLFPNISAKEKAEILNLAYVALTRAKSNLYIFANLDLNKIDDHKKKLNSWESLVANMRDCFMESEIDENDKEYFSAHKGDAKFCKISATEKFSSYIWQKEIWRKQKVFQPVKVTKINKQNALFGEVVHYYLSYIKWNNAAERKMAQKMTLAKFGRKWKFIFAKLDKFLLANSWLYDEKKWQIILCEYPIIHHDREYRLDRVMVCPDKKSATIVDFKTGKIEDPGQLNTYKELFQKSSNISNIETVFLQIK